MKHSSQPTLLVTAIVGVALLLPSVAAGGPPLICHPFDIAGAESLPWGEEGGWLSASKSYPVARLTQDVLDLLQPETEVLVRMETLRRATVYGRNAPGLAHELLSHLQARVLAAQADGRRDALAWFDAGYFVESMKQIGFIERNKGGRAFVGLDGYAWIQQAIGLSGDVPAMELAGALVRYERPEEHLEKAYRLTAKGSLVRRNLESHFPLGGR